jgi:hypothetical protein
MDRLQIILVLVLVAVLIHLSQMSIRTKDEILSFYFVLICMLDIVLTRL